MGKDRWKNDELISIFCTVYAVAGGYERPPEQGDWLMRVEWYRVVLSDMGNGVMVLANRVGRLAGGEATIIQQPRNEGSGARCVARCTIAQMVHRAPSRRQIDRDRKESPLNWIAAAMSASYNVQLPRAFG